MTELSPARKRLSVLLKAVVFVCAVTGTLLSALAGRRSFMGGSHVFMYFTIQSNLLVALISLLGLRPLLRGREPGTAWRTVTLVGAVSITLTGVVFAVLLAPLLGAHAWTLPNTLTHFVVPVAAVVDLFVSGSAAPLEKRHVGAIVIPPILYVIYAGIAFVRGWEFGPGVRYPYFFLNWGSPAGAFGFSRELPYMGCVWWILVLLLFLLAVGFGYLALAKRIDRPGTGR